MEHKLGWFKGRDDWDPCLNSYLTCYNIFACFLLLLSNREMIETLFLLNLTRSDLSKTRVGIGTKVVKDSSLEDLYLSRVSLYPCGLQYFTHPPFELWRSTFESISTHYIAYEITSSSRIKTQIVERTLKLINIWYIWYLN